MEAYVLMNPIIIRGVCHAASATRLLKTKIDEVGQSTLKNSHIPDRLAA